MESRMVDIVAGGFDAGIRMGHAVQRDIVAVPLGAIQRMVLVGSLTYLEERGTPNRPKDLLVHACIRLRFADQGRYLDWRFKSRDTLVVIEVRGPLVHSDMRCVLEAARQGVGLAFTALRAGRHVPPVLPAPRPNARQAESVHRLHAAEEPGTADRMTDGKG